MREVREGKGFSFRLILDCSFLGMEAIFFVYEGFRIRWVEMGRDLKGSGKGVDGNSFHGILFSYKVESDFDLR